MNGAQVVSTAAVGSIASSWSIALTGDYDGDGKSDLLWRHTSGNTAIWLMDGEKVATSAGLGSISTSWTVQRTNAE
jgi:FG-GAP repeat